MGAFYSTCLNVHILTSIAPVDIMNMHQPSVWILYIRQLGI